MIRFVVIFKLIDNSEQNVTLIKHHIMSLKEKMPIIKHMEVGSNLLLGERAFDLAALFDFDTMEDVHVFEQDPVHIEVVQRIKPAVAELKTVVYQQ